jgi:hypothetical protein
MKKPNPVNQNKLCSATLYFSCALQSVRSRELGTKCTRNVNLDWEGYYCDLVSTQNARISFNIHKTKRFLSSVLGVTQNKNFKVFSQLPCGLGGKFLFNSHFQKRLAASVGKSLTVYTNEDGRNKIRRR